MSKYNRKNREKPVLRNIIKSQNITSRSLLVLETRLDDVLLKEIVDNINESIQLINRLVEERNIPYYRIQQSNDYFNLDKARVLLRTENTDTRLLSNVVEEFKESSGNTFLVELYLNNNGYVEIGCVEDANLATKELSNFILIDQEYLSCALFDIFLDSAMFNSYSFLRELSVEDKRVFNAVKVKFLKSIYHDFTALDSPFYTFNNKRYQYLSIAFFARKSDDEVDLKKLIDLWNKFISQEYSEKDHSEQPVEKQLLSLVDYDQYSDKIKRDCCQLQKGSYWLLRVHRTPDEHIAKWLRAVMGDAEIGTEKILPFGDFDSVYELVRGQNITAFKIVVQ